MSYSDTNLDWLISNHAEFLGRFGVTEDKIIAEYTAWKKDNNGNTISDYLLSLLRQAFHFITKKATTEEEYYNWKLELVTKMWECSKELGKEDSNFWLQTIHFDKLMISHLSLPFKFNVQIDSKDCCSYCSKKNKKIVTFEKAIEKKYLPFTKCTRDSHCNCSYSIIPLNDENGKLVAKE